MCVSGFSLADVSVWFTLIGISLLGLYEYILKNGCTCSDNFSYQLWKCKQIKFRIVYGYDEFVKAMHGIGALIPYIALFIVSTAMTSFVKPYSVWIITCLYALCCVRTFILLKDTANYKWSIVVWYFVRIVAMISWFLVVWFLPRMGIQTLKGLFAPTIALLILILFIGISYYGQIISLLENEKFHLTVNVPCYGEADLNYFVFEMKNGTIYDSRDKLFYPVIQRDYVSYK